MKSRTIILYTITIFLSNSAVHQATVNCQSPSNDKNTRIFSGSAIGEISFPIGGIGTGLVGLGGRGQLRDWEIFNRPALPFVYSNEVWTGIEYQVAATLIYNGWVDEGLNIVKAARERYNGEEGIRGMSGMRSSLCACDGELGCSFEPIGISL